ncbi:MAG TPA: hypothetical protein VF233_11600 [Nitrososphaeraceae archaeon]
MSPCLQLNNNNAAFPGGSDVPEVTSVICRSWRNIKKEFENA